MNKIKPHQKAFVGICYFLACFAGISFLAGAQIKQAEQRIAKGRWEAARESLQKELSKDSLNTEAHFLLARFFFNEANPGRDLDSAYRFAGMALTDYSASSTRQKERLKRNSIDSLGIINFRRLIDSIAFENAKRLNTEDAYIYFLSTFSFAAQKEKAIDLRNEVAFLEALRKNSIDSYRGYLAKYPESARASEASERYERLLLDEHTRDGRLKSYQAFLSKFPQTKYRPQVERRIFEIMTASGKKEDYLAVIRQYPESSLRNHALRRLYYLSNNGNTLPPDLLTDSLRHVQELSLGYWVPFMKNGLFGFINQEGRETIEPKFTSVSPEYLCAPVREDFVITSQGLFARSGVSILADSVTEATDLGLGFIRVKSGGCVRVVQKSGFLLSTHCAEDARLVVNRFVAIRSNSAWGLFALNGLQLLPFEFQDILNIDGVMVLVRVGKSILVKPDDIAAIADKQPLKEQLVFDQVRTWGSGDLHVKSGVLEGVLNQDLEFVVPFDRQLLVKTSFGFTIEKDGQLKIVGASTQLEGKNFRSVRDFGAWLELDQPPDRALYHVATGRMIDRSLDSVWVRNKVLFALSRDTVRVYGKQGRITSFLRSSTVQFINSRDTTVFFLIQEKNKRSVFDAATGKKIFTAEFDDLEYVGAGIFLFTRNKKKGLFSMEGKIILAPQYDVIVYSSNGFLSLYKDKKFGLFDMRTRRLIKPVYERNVTYYGGDLFVAFRNGAYGFISADEHPISEFQFEEIRYWNDSSALVRRNFMWQVYAIKERVILLDRIRSYDVMSNGDETVLRIQKENYFGIVSNRRGVVIPASFSEIMNLGTQEKPLYFTEKRVEEADIFVVIYYDDAGRFIRKQVYEAEEYERIFCEEQ